MGTSTIINVDMTVRKCNEDGHVFVTLANEKVQCPECLRSELRELKRTPQNTSTHVDTSKLRQAIHDLTKLDQFVSNNPDVFVRTAYSNSELYTNVKYALDYLNSVLNIQEPKEKTQSQISYKQATQRLNR